MKVIRNCSVRGKEGPSLREIPQEDGQHVQADQMGPGAVNQREGQRWTEPRFPARAIKEPLA